MVARLSVNLPKASLETLCLIALYFCCFKLVKDLCPTLAVSDPVLCSCIGLSRMHILESFHGYGKKVIPEAEGCCWP